MGVMVLALVASIMRLGTKHHRRSITGLRQLGSFQERTLSQPAITKSTEIICIIALHCESKTIGTCWVATHTNLTLVGSSDDDNDMVSLVESSWMIRKAGQNSTFTSQVQSFYC